MAATALSTRDRIVARQARTGTGAWWRAAYITSGLLAAVSVVAASATFFVPGVLRGPAVMNGSGRGTALVMLVLGLPVLLAAMYFAGRGSVRARIVWLGAAGYFAYNGVMFVLATPFNQLYLLYEAIVGLSLWTTVLVIRSIDLGELSASFSKSFPTRWIAGYLIAIATLNGVVWLTGAIPSVLSTAVPAKVLAGTGVATVPTYDQDLAFWIPLMFVAAIWMWRGIEWGRLIVGAMLAMGVVESVGVAVDQWMGSAADPSSTVASAAMTPVFGVLAVIGLIPLILYLRAMRDRV